METDTCRPLNSAHLWTPIYTICGFLCTLHIYEPHLYMARPASTSIQSRAKSICRTKDDILFTTVCATPRTISGRFLMILSCDLKSFPFHQVSSHLPISGSILLHPLLTQSHGNWEQAEPLTLPITQGLLMLTLREKDTKGWDRMMPRQPPAFSCTGTMDLRE